MNTFEAWLSQQISDNEQQINDLRESRSEYDRRRYTNALTRLITLLACRDMYNQSKDNEVQDEN